MRFKSFSATANILGVLRAVEFDGEKLTIGNVTSDDVTRFVDLLQGKAANEQASASGIEPSRVVRVEKSDIASSVKPDEQPAPAAESKPAVEPSKAEPTTTSRRSRKAATTETPPAPAATPPAEPVVKTAGVTLAQEPAKDASTAAPAADVVSTPEASTTPPAGPDNYLEGDPPGPKTERGSQPDGVAASDDEIPFGGEEAILAAEEKAAPAAKPGVPDVLPANIVNAGRLRDVLEYLMTFGYETKEDLAAQCRLIQPKVPLLTRIENIEDRVTRTLQVIRGS